MRVVEFTGGSTGSSLAMVCAAKGYRFVVLSSDAFAHEKLRTMRAFGAELRIVPSDGGKVTPALFERFKQEIAVLAGEPDTFWTDQFNNTDALDGYGASVTNCWSRPAERSMRSAAPSAPAGCCAACRARFGSRQPRAHRRARARGVARADRGRGGAHRVEGIGTGRVPPHMADRPYDEARAIDEDEARAMAGGSRAKKACSSARRAGSTSPRPWNWRRNWARQDRGDRGRRHRLEISGW